MTTSTIVDNRGMPEAPVTRVHRRGEIAPEAQLALDCARVVAKAFREAGYRVHSCEVMVHETPARELAYGHAIGKVSVTA